MVQKRKTPKKPVERKNSTKTTLIAVHQSEKANKQKSPPKEKRDILKGKRKSAKENAKDKNKSPKIKINKSNVKNASPKNYTKNSKKEKLEKIVISVKSGKDKIEKKGKGVKRKLSDHDGKQPAKKKIKGVSENGDSDDDDVLYSLVDEITAENQNVANVQIVKPKSKRKSVSHHKEKDSSVDMNKSNSCSQLTDGCKSESGNSSRMNNNKRLSLSLLSGMKQKPNKPRSLKTQIDKDVFKEPEVPQSSSSSLSYYTSVKPSPSPTPSLLSKPMPSHSSITMESYFADIPSYQMASIIPGSPSTMSYKALLENLPQQMHPKKKRKESDTESDDGQIERRTSVRSAECAFRNKDIVVKKCHRYTQIWLNTQTQLKNVLNPQVIQEIVTALNSAKYDDSNLVMFSGIGNVFCSGVDLNFLTTGDPKIAARKMADSVRELVKTFITFPKPIIAVVTGAAVGLGMAILPLCDITYASDKALFYLPYSTLSQTPEGCSSFTLPQVLGLAVGSEILFCGRKLTALEAHQLGLVSQVFWPTSMMQEVIPRIQQMALFSGKALETTKLLIRCHNRTKLELTNETECNLLLEKWPTAECQRAILAYLDNEKNFIF